MSSQVARGYIRTETYQGEKMHIESPASHDEGWIDIVSDYFRQVRRALASAKTIDTADFWFTGIERQCQRYR